MWVFSILKYVESGSANYSSIALWIYQVITPVSDSNVLFNDRSNHFFWSFKNPVIEESVIQESLVSVQQAQDAMSDTLAFPKQNDSISEITFGSMKFLAYS